jgi:very-short-patch-repair endonuclease
MRLRKRLPKGNGIRNWVPLQTRIWARSLRNHATQCERLLWQHIRCNKLGFRFHRQSILFGWIADFYCPAKKLVVEIDDPSHRQLKKKAKDAVRDRVLQEKGFRTLRFANEEVLVRLPEVVFAIRGALTS